MVYAGVVYLSNGVVGGFSAEMRSSGKLAGSLCMEPKWLATTHANGL